MKYLVSVLCLLPSLSSTSNAEDTCEGQVATKSMCGWDRLYFTCCRDYTIGESLHSLKNFARDNRLGAPEYDCIWTEDESELEQFIIDQAAQGSYCEDSYYNELPNDPNTICVMLLALQGDRTLSNGYIPWQPDDCTEGCVTATTSESCVAYPDPDEPSIWCADAVKVRVCEPEIVEKQ